MQQRINKDNKSLFDEENKGLFHEENTMPLDDVRTSEVCELFIVSNILFECFLL